MKRVEDLEYYKRLDEIMLNVLLKGQIKMVDHLWMIRMLEELPKYIEDGLDGINIS